MTDSAIGRALTRAGAGIWLEDATKIPSSSGRATGPTQAIQSVSYDASAVFGVVGRLIAMLVDFAAVAMAGQFITP